jgi:hypothetical protein
MWLARRDDWDGVTDDVGSDIDHIAISDLECGRLCVGQRGREQLGGREPGRGQGRSSESSICSESGGSEGRSRASRRSEGRCRASRRSGSRIASGSGIGPGIRGGRAGMYSWIQSLHPAGAGRRLCRRLWRRSSICARPHHRHRQ